MFAGAKVAVVIPAFNEQDKIAATIASIPDYIDEVIVVDDASRDETFAVANAAANTSATANHRIWVVRHGENGGVGAAIVTGYRHALLFGCNVIAVMAGDGQMDPADLPAVIDPIIRGAADYVKGNRFRHPDIWRAMPPIRIVGNTLLSTITKVTSGYFHIFDSQCGYTAISASALRAVDLDGIFPRYGYPNDLLARLRVAKQRVEEVQVRPVYGQTWRSGINFKTIIHPIPWVLTRSFGHRLVHTLKQRRD